MPKYELLNGMEGVRPVLTDEGKDKGVSIEEVFLPLLKIKNVLVGWLIRDPDEGEKYYSIAAGWTTPPRCRNATA